MRTTRSLLSESAVLRANAQWQIEARPIQSPLPDECRIRVRAAGVCSSDIARAYQDKAYFYPLVPGHEIAGEVESVGSRGGWSVGDRVVVYPLIHCGKCLHCFDGDTHLCESYGYYGSRQDGGFQQRLNVKSANLLAVPEGVSFESAALTEPLSVVIHALNKADASGAKRILISGAGTLGLMALEVLHFLRSSSEVLIADRNADKLALCRRHAVKIAHLPSVGAWQDFEAKQAGKWDLILEFTGDKRLVDSAAVILAPKGKLICVGNPAHDFTVSRSAMDKILRKEISIQGSWNSTVDPDWKQSLSLLGQGLELRSMISKTTSLMELPELLSQMHQRKNTAAFTSIVKVVCLP